MAVTGAYLATSGMGIVLPETTIQCSPRTLLYRAVCPTSATVYLVTVPRDPGHALSPHKDIGLTPPVFQNM